MLYDTMHILRPTVFLCAASLVCCLDLSDASNVSLRNESSIQDGNVIIQSEMTSWASDSFADLVTVSDHASLSPNLSLSASLSTKASFSANASNRLNFSPKTTSLSADLSTSYIRPDLEFDFVQPFDSFILFRGRDEASFIFCEEYPGIYPCCLETCWGWEAKSLSARNHFKIFLQNATKVDEGYYELHFANGTIKSIVVSVNPVVSVDPIGDRTKDSLNFFLLMTFDGKEQNTITAGRPFRAICSRGRDAIFDLPKPLMLTDAGKGIFRIEISDEAIEAPPSVAVRCSGLEDVASVVWIDFEYGPRLARVLLTEADGDVEIKSCAARLRADCFVDANPPASILWSHVGLNATFASAFACFANASTRQNIYFQSTPSKKGLLVCQASNAHGTATAFAQVGSIERRSYFVFALFALPFVLFVFFAFWMFYRHQCPCSRRHGRNGRQPSPKGSDGKAAAEKQQDVGEQKIVGTRV